MKTLILDSFVRGERVLVLSSLTVQELLEAPVLVRSRLASVPDKHIATATVGIPDDRDPDAPGGFVR